MIAGGTASAAAGEQGSTTAGTFTTDGLGVVPDGDGDVDHVVRKEAWERAHPGGTIGREFPDQLSYTARWPDGTVAARAYASLGSLIVKLDRAEEQGRCPVHRETS